MRRDVLRRVDSEKRSQDPQHKDIENEPPPALEPSPEPEVESLVADHETNHSPIVTEEKEQYNELCKPVNCDQTTQTKHEECKSCKILLNDKRILKNKIIDLKSKVQQKNLEIKNITAGKNSDGLYSMSLV